MGLFLELAFLFLIGSVLGWGLEVVFRRFFAEDNPERKWINPGFCTGPYLPIYGCGLCGLYLIAGLEGKLPWENTVAVKIFLLLAMALCMTLIEYIAGLVSLKVAKVRLWDYSGKWGNIQGIICPLFSFYWTLLGAGYYFLIHPYILGAVRWFSQNLAFSFVVGVFFGVFAIDVAHSARLVVRLKKFAEENAVILKYEAIKAGIRSHYEKAAKKYRFFHPFRTERPLSEHLREMRELFEKRGRKRK